MKNKFCLLMLIVITLFASSCADSKDFKDEKGKSFTAEPYGWANSDANKVDGVVYEVNFGNVFWSVVFSETIIVPVYLTGWKLFEPVRYNQTAE